MKLEFSIVPHGHVTSMIPGLMTYLKKSEMWTRGRACVDDIVAFLLTGHMTLWVAFDPDSKTVYGHVISEIKQYPRQKWLVLQYIAAEPHCMKEVEDKVYPVLDAYAKDMGCVGIEAFGRPGWGKHLKERGYTTQTVVYERYFSGEST